MSAFLIHIGIITVFDLIGVVFAKLYSIHKNPLLILGTFIFFGGAGFVFAKSLKYEGMAIANILWIALSVILVTIIGYFFFKENISPLQFVGIGVITIGLILVNLEQTI